MQSPDPAIRRDGCVTVKWLVCPRLSDGEADGGAPEADAGAAADDVLRIPRADALEEAQVEPHARARCQHADGAAADAGLLYEVALRVANGAAVPEWKPTSEFRSRRRPAR